MRPIDADALKNMHFYCDDGSYVAYSIIREVMKNIEKAPTVGGLSCESCQKWDHSDGIGVSARKCEEWGRITSKREFCSRWKEVRK